MPNHLHGIIKISNKNDGSQTNGRGRPMFLPKFPYLPKSIGEHMGSPLPKIVQWLKIMTTSEYIREIKAGNLKTI
jgi:hypothetical protein